MNLPKDYALRAGELGDPVLWVATPSPDFAFPPAIAMRLLEGYFGPGRSRRLNTWKRAEADPDGPHLIGVRGGTPLHKDPAYPRYTHQLVLYNGGWGLTGFDRSPVHALEAGSLFCCDTHSPHQVVPLPGRRDLYYLAASMDAAAWLPAAACRGRLADFAGSLLSEDGR